MPSQLFYLLFGVYAQHKKTVKLEGQELGASQVLRNIMSAFPEYKGVVNRLYQGRQIVLNNSA
jgi:hypothetical protein